MSAKKKQKVPFPSLIKGSTSYTGEEYSKLHLQDEDELEQSDEPKLVDKAKPYEELKASRVTSEDIAGDICDESGNSKGRGRVDKVRIIVMAAIILMLAVGVWNISSDVAIESNIKSHLPWIGNGSTGNSNARSKSESTGNTDGTRESSIDYTKKLEVLEYDINYSQTEGDLESGVDTLIHVKNNNTVSIKGVQFTLAGKSGDNVENINSGNSYFQGDGYVAAGKSGYIYSKMYILNGTPASQGKLTFTDAYESKKLDADNIANGTVTTFHKEADSYDVRIKNLSAETIPANDSIIIAIQNGYSKLASSWAAGRLTDDLKPGQEVTVKNAIHNPGFVKFTEHKYETFIIDKSRLRM